MPPEKKILFIAHGHPAVRPGGAEGHALDLHEALRARGEYEPVYLARNERADRAASQRGRTPICAVDGRPGHYFLYTSASDWDFLFGRSSDKMPLTRFFRDFLAAQRPDVIHIQHTMFLGYDMLRVIRDTLPDTPIVYTLHDYMPICYRGGQMIRTGTNHLCRAESPRRCNECFPDVSPQVFFTRKRFVQSHLGLVDLFIAPSAYVRDRYVDWGIAPEKIRVVPYGRPTAAPVPEVPEDRPRNRFAFFGQFTPFKGTDVLLEAMALLGDDFDGHLWIHAANLELQPRDFQDKLKELLEQTRDTVTLAGGYQPADLAQLLSAIDWVIVPSIWWETGPLVVLEAFQHGRPIISSDIGGMSEKVTDDVDGLHFRTGDAEDLAEVMTRAATTPGLWDRLQQGIGAVWDIGGHSEVMTGIYDGLIEARAGAQPADRREPAGAR